MIPRLPLAIAVLFIVSGCAAHVATEPDSSHIYLIVAKPTPRTKSLSDLQADTLRRATIMCQSEGRGMVPLAVDAQKQTGSIPYQVTVKYTCGDRKRR